MITSHPRIIIIGGGISGLVVAYRLHKEAQRLQRPIDLHLLESSPRLGGIIKTISRDGFLLEGGPDCFVTDKPRGIELCRELGLAEEVIPTRSEHRRSFVVKRGRLHPVPEGFYLIAPTRLRPFLKSPILSWRGKLRVLTEPLIGKKIPSPCEGEVERSLAVAKGEGGGEGITDESLASFVRRRLGPEALDSLAQPLLAGIYGADPETLSLRSTFPQFLEMEEKHGSVIRGLRAKAHLNNAGKASGARYGLFVSFRNGMQTLVDRLEHEISSKITVRKNTTVKEIRQNPAARKDQRINVPQDRADARTLDDNLRRWIIVLGDGTNLEADAVCLALPAYRCGELLASLNQKASTLLDSIPYSGSAVIHLAFRRNDVRHPLNGFGFVVPRVEKRFLLACTFSHEKFEGRAPEGCVLLRGFVGGALQEHVLQASDSTLEKRSIQDLHELLGLGDAPLFSAVERHARAMPQYTLGHLERVGKIQEELKTLPGLALAGNWMNGVGIPDCIESGEWAASELL